VDLAAIRARQTATGVGRDIDAARIIFWYHAAAVLLA
jgi:hypothetical protein